MNYSVTIVKIVYIDSYLYYNENIPNIYWIELYGKLIDQSRLVKIIVWKNYLKDILAYYNLNDYIIIEGYINFIFENEFSLKNLDSVLTVKKLIVI